MTRNAFALTTTIVLTLLVCLSMPAANGCKRKETRWNVLILVPDTVRGDHLSINGYSKRTSPALDALARDGVNFTDAVSVAPRTWQSFTSILTGLYPVHHGVRHIFDQPLSPTIPSMGSMLREAGSETRAFDGILLFLKNNIS